MADVGIVMPVYKQKTAFLQAAIRSILRQKYRTFKLAIVINGTSANAVQTVRKMTRCDRRVRTVAYRVNQGTSHTLNTGFELLKRNPSIQYLTWVSSDIIYYPHNISTLQKSLVNAPEEIGFVYSSCQHISNYRIRSTFSMSRKLSTSLKLNRRIRYITQLIWLEAWQRRQIPLETTIIFKHSNSSNQLERLNRLLDQSCHNYT